jgi:hypothetical protein
MMSLRSTLAALLLLASGLSTPAVASDEVVAGNVTVKVAQRDEAAEAIIANAREAGGWFSTLAGDHITLRVPADHVEPLMAFAAELGVLTDRQISRSDYSHELSQARARLATREEMLEQYMEVLEGASAKSVVTVEREVTRLVSEIEQLKGRIRYLEDQVGYGTVTVWFEFRDRAAPARDGSSSFAWLNSLNITDLLGEFRWLDTRGKTTTWLQVPPDGFAPYKAKKAFRAVSPDGVVFRVRAAEHEPEADLSFWKEAMGKRMVEAGYQVLAESEISASGTAGTLLELTAPYGTDDYSYLLAIFPAGKEIVIVEAAGEVATFAARRDAIIQAIGQVQP